MFQLSTFLIKGPNIDSSYQQAKCLNSRPICCLRQNYESTNLQNYGSGGQQNYGSYGQQNYGSSGQQNYVTTGQQDYGSTAHNCPSLLCNLPLCNNNTDNLGNSSYRIRNTAQIDIWYQKQKYRSESNFDIHLQIRNAWLKLPIDRNVIKMRTSLWNNVKKKNAVGNLTINQPGAFIL